MIRKWIKKTFTKNYIFRLELVFASIIILLSIFLCILISNNINKVLIEKQLSANNIILNNLYRQFNADINSAYSVLSQVYRDKTLGTLLFNLLESNQTKYLDVNPLDKRVLVNSIKVLANRDKTIAAITIYQKEKNIFYQYVSETSQFYEDVVLSPIYKNMKTDDFSLRILPLREVYSKPRYGVLYKLISPVSFRDQGSILIEYEMGTLMDSVSAYNASQNGTILILGNSGEVIFNSTGEYSNNKYPYFSSIIQANGQGYIDIGEKCVVAKFEVTRASIFLFGITPYRQIRQAIDPTLETIYLFTGITILLMLMAYFVSMCSLTSRVNRVLGGISRVQQGDLRSRIQLPSRNRNDEINLIAESFNSMCDELQQHIAKTVKAQIRQKNAELESLQAKINPHFLYNTLEAIRMRANGDGNKETADMIYLFALMFRNMFRGEMFIPIEIEVESCRIYIEMFLIRYNHKFKASYHINKEIGGYLIPRNTLQPVIENYFIHGYEPEKTDSRIDIYCNMIGDIVTISIVDNGRGIQPDKLDEINLKLHDWQENRDNSIGLANVNERIKLIFGEQYGVEVGTTSNGASVIIQFPAVTEDPIKGMRK